MTDSRYGYYRYGRHTYEPPERPERAPPERDVTRDPHEVFGAGVALRTADDHDEGAPWGFVVDATGDLAATSGYDELAKDLAWSTAVDSITLTGQLGTPNERAKLETEIERIAEDDDRVKSVEARVGVPGEDTINPDRRELATNPNAGPSRRADTIVAHVTVRSVLDQTETLSFPLLR